MFFAFLFTRGGVAEIVADVFGNLPRGSMRS
jgi:hypothetical protein